MYSWENRTIIFKTQLCQYFQRPNISFGYRKAGGAKSIYRFANQVFNQLLSFFGVLPEFFPIESKRQFVLVWMTSNMMTMRMYPSDYVGMFFCNPSEAKESRFYSSDIQFFKNFYRRSVNIIDFAIGFPALRKSIVGEIEYNGNNDDEEAKTYTNFSRYGKA